ncbi:MAG: hypothetical protein HY735_14155 [Verrucomicrobia bacterium]|nr:hypothetical protein [Verrucomicrobiota bacterium]
MQDLSGRKPRFYQGDIVYGYLRLYLNKVWIAEFDGLCSVDQYIYTVDAVQADAEFLAAFMHSPIFLERAPIATTPGQLPRIRKEEVASVEVILPPLQKQRRLASELSRMEAETLRLRSALAAQLAALDALSAALLREAFGC